MTGSHRKCVNRAPAQSFDRCVARGSQRSEFLVLTKRSAACEEENDPRAIRDISGLFSRHLESVLHNKPTTAVFAF